MRRPKRTAKWEGGGSRVKYAREPIKLVWITFRELFIGVVASAAEVEAQAKVEAEAGAHEM